MSAALMTLMAIKQGTTHIQRTAKHIQKWGNITGLSKKFGIQQRARGHEIHFRRVQKKTQGTKLPVRGGHSSPGQHARHWASKRRLLQPRSVTAPGRLYFSGFSASDGNHRRIRVGGVRNLKTRTQAPGSGLGAARGSTPKTGTQTSLPYIAWRREYERLGSPRFEPAPTASAMARGVRTAEGGAREAGTRARPQGSPGQHARHWASKSALCSSNLS